MSLFDIHPEAVAIVIPFLIIAQWYVPRVGRVCNPELRGGNVQTGPLPPLTDRCITMISDSCSTGVP